MYAVVISGGKQYRVAPGATLVVDHVMAEDHMKRVSLQGDLRPMAASREAMEDLKRILSGRAAFYSKAEFRLDTSARPLAPTFAALRELVRGALQRPD